MRPGLRRALHVATALVVPVGVWAGWPETRWALTLAVPAAYALEVLRWRTGMGSWLSRRLPVYRTHEARRLSGAFWLLGGYAAAAWLPVQAASVGILAGALADPLASLVGGRWGRGTAGQKTVVGTAGCAVAVTAIALFYGAGVGPALTMGTVGAILERWSGPVDDNLLLAPGVGAVFWAWL